MAVKIKGKILRHKYIKDLGFYVRGVKPGVDSTYELKVRYLSVSGHLKWGQTDIINVNMPYIISQFEILQNPDKIKSFKQAKWSSLSF